MPAFGFNGIKGHSKGGKGKMPWIGVFKPPLVYSLTNSMACFTKIVLFMFCLCALTGRQCLCSGERDWIWAVSGQWALLWPGQCKWKTHCADSVFCSHLHLTRALIPLYVVCVILVWEHLLLQLGVAGSLLLPTVSGEDLGVPQSASAEGEPAHLPGRPVPQYRQPEEESGSYTTQEVHHTATQGEWWEKTEFYQSVKSSL